MMNVLKFTQNYADISGIPSYMTSDNGNRMQNQEEFIGRHARIRLDYKKSFQDDLIFFPEPKNESLSILDNNFVLQGQRHGNQHSIGQRDNTLVLLMALKRQQQQQLQFIQNQMAIRNEISNGAFHQPQPLLQERHFGENYISPQNGYNYMNLRVRG